MSYPTTSFWPMRKNCFVEHAPAKLMLLDPISLVSPHRYFTLKRTNLRLASSKLWYKFPLDWHLSCVKSYIAVCAVCLWHTTMARKYGLRASSGSCHACLLVQKSWSFLNVTIICSAPAPTTEPFLHTTREISYNMANVDTVTLLR